MPKTAGDLTGQRFGKLTVVGYGGLRQEKRQKVSVWNCVCDCGRACVVPGYLLKRGRRKSCGCIRAAGNDLIGKRFGKLVVMSEDTSKQTTLQKVICVCDCGNKISVATRNLKNGKIRDCGCGREPAVKGEPVLEQQKKERVSQRICRFYEGKITSSDSLEVWSDIWIGAVLPNVIKETTIRMYAETLERHILPYLGSVSLGNLSDKTLSSWISRLREKSSAGGRKMTEGTLRNTFSILNGCLRDAQKAGLMTQNPCQDFCWDMKARNLWEEGGGLDEKQIACLEPWLAAYKDRDGYPLGIAYELVLYAGITMSEAAALRWEDVDLEGHRLFIRKFLTERKSLLDGPAKNVYTVENAVGKRRREVPLPENLCGKLSHIQQVFGGEKQDYLIPSGEKGPVRLDRLRSALTRQGKNCGIGNVTPRMLRDSYAMRAVRAGATSDELAELMGFASPQQVIRRYMPRKAGDKRRLVDRMFEKV